MGRYVGGWVVTGRVGLGAVAGPALLLPQNTMAPRCHSVTPTPYALSPQP